MDHVNKASSNIPRVMLIKPLCYSDVISPPLGLGYLAASLAGIADVTIVDGVKQRMRLSRLAQEIRLFQPDIIGLSVVSAARDISLQYIRFIRQILPRVIILAGGPHPSLMPESYYEAARGDLDYILRGDAESALRLFVECYGQQPSGCIDIADIQQIPGVFTQLAGVVIQTPMPINQACDNPIMPNWELMPPASYPQAPQGAFFHEFPIAPLITSRGCPFECGFCSVGTLKGKTVRFRHPDLIIDEIKLLKKQYGVRELQFIDDNLTASKPHIMSLCESMLSNDLAMPWSCPNGVRADMLDEEIITAMKAAGCYSLSIGLEAGTQLGLERMKKRLNLEQAINVIHLIARKKLEVNGFFVIGYPGETRQNIRDTINLAKTLPLTRAHFMLFTPLPGCEVFERISQGNNGIRYDSSFARVSYVPEGFTPRQLKWWHRRAMISFYGRLKKAGQLMSDVNSPEKAFFFFRRIWHWLVGI